NVPAVDRTSLENHVNGVSGLRGVVLRAQEPARHRGFIEAFTGVPATGNAERIRVVLPNADLVVERDAGSTGLACHAVRFACRDMDLLRTRLEAASIVFKAADGAISVPPAPGQGATFIFEE
ncbi:MAG: hypothetical protein KDJ89_10930, partial [Notoacmeibacter sp.]|nr:hypothetical protein [Notoacmeibacter sp.]